MIEKITTDKYLYQGRIVDKAFLVARKDELEQLIAANEQAIKDIKLIEMIPEIEAVPEYREAAEMFNRKKKSERELLENEMIHFSVELKAIDEIL